MKQLTILTIFLLFSLKVFSCSCIGPKKMNKKQFKDYDLIAQGTVDRIETSEWTRTIFFKVETAFKGAKAGEIIKITTASDGGMCGISAEVGEKWLMYGGETEDGFSTDLCTRTRNMEKDYNQAVIKKDLRFLKKKMRKRKS